MVLFLNQTGTIGIIFNASVNNLTGSPFMTLVLWFFVIVLFFMIFRIPFELTAVLVLPLMLIYMAFFGEFLTIGLLMLMYIGLLFAKYFLIK